MANVEVKPINVRKFAQLNEMARQLDKVSSLKTIQPLTPMGAEEMASSTEIGFQNYYDATRTVTKNEDGNLNIAVDSEMVRAGSQILLQKGFPQFIKHEVLLVSDQVGKRP